MIQDWLQSATALAAHGPFVVLLVIALATYISEDIACIVAGLLVANGSLHFPAAAAACFIGILSGDLFLVLVGRTLGRRAIAAAPLRWIVTPEAVVHAERWFARRGAGLVFASRFMPGTRMPIYVAAGVLRAPWLPFTGWFALGAVIWTPVLVGAASVLGEGVFRLLKDWSNATPVFIAAGVSAWLTLRLIVSLSTWRGRRLLLSRWSRLVRWEFWPAWIVHIPVVLYVLWQGLRHRSLTLPTAVNPGISHGGGLVGESKSEILRGLAGAGGTIVRWCPIPSGPAAERASIVRGFMQRERLAFPFVIKPDVGERGQGVVIVRDDASLETVLDQARTQLIGQEYVPGLEYGVFYHRRPGAANGEVLAITDKRVVAVTGDGEHTLEELILGDNRAVCRVRFFLRQHADRLDWVPASGEQVALSELGTRSRGARFLDGTHLSTPALVAAVDRVSHAFQGFYFGSYDMRAESAEAFQRGEFKVIELNGLTAEATSIYDPRHSVWFAWRMLCRQWRIAFEIAAEHRERGVQPLSLREIWRIVTRLNAGRQNLR